MIDRSQIKPGMVIKMPDDWKGHSFSNVAAGWVIVIYYTCEHLCTGMNVKRVGSGMDIDWQDIEHGEIVNTIPEPEDGFYEWVAKGRTSSPGETKEFIKKKYEYRSKFKKLIFQHYPEYRI